MEQHYALLPHQKPVLRRYRFFSGSIESFHGCHDVTTTKTYPEIYGEIKTSAKYRKGGTDINALEGSSHHKMVNDD